MPHLRPVPATARPGGKAAAFVPGQMPARLARPWRPVQQTLDTRRWLLFIVVHAPLVMAIKNNPMIATVHTLVTLAIGLRCLQFRSPERLVCVLGYIVASEPLWRVGRALIFHETAKYAVGGLSLLAILRYQTLRQADKSPLLYFALLLPSIMMLPEFDRRAISFNLSGPFALAMSATFMSSLRVPPQVLRRVVLTSLAPIIGFAFLATFSTLTAPGTINFFVSKTTAGGLGNNQGSSILGLGAVLAFVYTTIAPQPRLLRWFVAGVGLWCAVQGALTFSRGGVATAVGAIAAMCFFLIRDRRFRGAVVLRVGLIATIVAFVAIPFLNAFTTGGFKARYTNTHLTGRDRIIEADFIAFRENPIFGVGPGQSKDYHALTFGRASTHTEYSRLLAEHGSLGLAALLLLGWMTLRRLFRSSPHAGKAFAAGFTVWAALFMFHAAMRMAAAGFVFALGSAYLMAEAPRRVPARSRHRPRVSQPAPPRPPRQLPAAQPPT